MVLQDFLGEGANEADQEGEEHEGDKEDCESCNRNCDVPIMVFSCSMIF